MPTYFLTNQTSDLSGKLFMGHLENTTTTYQVSCSNQGTTILDIVTHRPYPNVSGFTVSNGLVVITHTVTNLNLTVSAQLIRINSAGTVVTSGTASAAATVAVTNTFNALVDASWTGSTCSDRIMLRLTYVNAAKSTQTCTIGTDRSSTYCYSSITIEGSAACRDTLRNKNIIAYRNI